MRFLRNLWPRPPIVLTGELFAPAPGQVLVLTTDQHLSAEQRRSLQESLVAMFGSMNRVFVVCGSARLSVEKAEDPSSEGSKDA